MDEGSSARSPKVERSEGTARPRKQRARQQRTVDTRERILDAAVVEFARHGFGGASTRRIAAQAGVQHGLITYHFENKEGLWREALKLIQNEWSELLRARLHGLRGVESATTLRLILEDFIQFSARNPNFHAIMSHASSTRDGRLDWLVVEYVKPHFDTLAQLIREAQKAGRFVAGDPIKLQYLFIGAAVRVFMVSEEASIITGVSPFSEGFIKEHAELCLGLFFRD